MALVRIWGYISHRQTSTVNFHGLNYTCIVAIAAQNLGHPVVENVRILFVLTLNTCYNTCDVYAKRVRLAVAFQTLMAHITQHEWGNSHRDEPGDAPTPKVARMEPGSFPLYFGYTCAWYKLNI